VFFHLSSRHCHFVQLNDSEFLKYCRMMTLLRIVFLFLTLLFPKRWISQKYRITQSKFTLSYFILVNDCTLRSAFSSFSFYVRRGSWVLSPATHTHPLFSFFLSGQHNMKYSTKHPWERPIRPGI
jgi:hypothetical protein